jgi:hypothetical protein
MEYLNALRMYSAAQLYGALGIINEMEVWDLTSGNEI